VLLKQITPIIMNSG